MKWWGLVRTAEGGPLPPTPEGGPLLGVSPKGLDTPSNRNARVDTPKPEGHEPPSSKHHLCLSGGPNLPSVMGEGETDQGQGSRAWATLQKRASETRPHHGPPGPAPFTLPSRGEKARHPPSVPRSSDSDPCVPDRVSTRTSPWATPPRGAGTGYFWQLLCLARAAHCDSDSHSFPAPLGTAGWEEERLSFTLTQLLREGFLSLVQALRPALGSGGGSERCWRRADPALGLPLTLEFFNRHHLRRFGPELESFGGLGGGGGSGGGARSLER